MNIKSDIEIAQEHTPKKITEIAAAAGIDEKYLELYEMCIRDRGRIM